MVTSKRRCCKFCRGLSPPITVLSERKESTTTAHFPMGSKRFSHVLFCRSEHRNIFAFADQSIYLSRWVPHSLLILGARFKRRLKTSSDDTMYFFAIAAVQPVRMPIGTSDDIPSLIEGLRIASGHVLFSWDNGSDFAKNEMFAALELSKGY